MTENWTVGKQRSTVVSDSKQINTNFPCPPNYRESQDDEIEYYGGFLVCESVGNDKTAMLISAAPELLEALTLIREYWNAPSENKSMNQHIDFIIATADKAIKKATE